MIENHISDNLYYKLFSESCEEKCTVFQSMARSLIVHKILLKSAQEHFLLISFYVSFICFLIKARVLLQFLLQFQGYFSNSCQKKVILNESLFNKFVGHQG